MVGGILKEEDEEEEEEDDDDEVMVGCKVSEIEIKNWYRMRIKKKIKNSFRYIHPPIHMHMHMQQT